MHDQRAALHVLEWLADVRGRRTGKPTSYTAPAMDSTRTFWNDTPCGAHEDDQDALTQFRQRMIPRRAVAFRERLASAHRQVLDVGCGQGADARALCRQLRPGSQYIGIDVSETSVRLAARPGPGLGVQPSFIHGSAEALPFPDAVIESVWSNGVLHHMAEPARGIAEVHRVLRPGGRAYVTLYRTWSPKLLLAHVLRGVQAAFDRMLRRDRTFYAWIVGRHLPRQLGTMIVEGVGVPYLHSYTAAEVRALCRPFTVRTLEAVGRNLAGLVSEDARTHPVFGHLWLVELEK
jgi:ubiquinone/menaquinone biosynthesis C-methylase UbiE